MGSLSRESTSTYYLDGERQLLRQGWEELRIYFLYKGFKQEFVLPHPTLTFKGIFVFAYIQSLNLLGLNGFHQATMGLPSQLFTFSICPSTSTPHPLCFYQDSTSCHFSSLPYPFSLWICMIDLYSYFGDSHKPSEINWHVQHLSRMG